MNEIAMNDYLELAEHIRDTLGPGEYDQNKFGPCGCFISHAEQNYSKVRIDLGITYLQRDYIFGHSVAIQIAARILGLPTPTDFTIEGLINRFENIFYHD